MPQLTHVPLLQTNAGEKHSGIVVQQSSPCPPQTPPRAVPVTISSRVTPATVANPAEMRAMPCTRRPYPQRPIRVNRILTKTNKREAARARTGRFRVVEPERSRARARYRKSLHSHRPASSWRSFGVRWRSHRFGVGWALPANSAGGRRSVGAVLATTGALAATSRRCSSRPRRRRSGALNKEAAPRTASPPHHNHTHLTPACSSAVDGRLMRICRRR